MNIILSPRTSVPPLYPGSQVKILDPEDKPSMTDTERTRMMDESNESLGPRRRSTTATEAPSESSKEEDPACTDGKGGNEESSPDSFEEFLKFVDASKEQGEPSATTNEEGDGGQEGGDDTATNTKNEEGEADILSPTEEGAPASVDSPSNDNGGNSTTNNIINKDEAEDTGLDSSTPGTEEGDAAVESPSATNEGGTEGHENEGGSANNVDSSGGKDATASSQDNPPNSEDSLGGGDESDAATASAPQDNPRLDSQYPEGVEEGATSSSQDNTPNSEDSLGGKDEGGPTTASAPQDNSPVNNQDPEGAEEEGATSSSQDKPPKSEDSDATSASVPQDNSPVDIQDPEASSPQDNTPNSEDSLKGKDEGGPTTASAPQDEPTDCANTWHAGQKETAQDSNLDGSDISKSWHAGQEDLGDDDVAKYVNINKLLQPSSSEYYYSQSNRSTRQLVGKVTPSKRDKGRNNSIDDSHHSRVSVISQRERRSSYNGPKPETKDGEPLKSIMKKPSTLSRQSSSDNMSSPRRSTDPTSLRRCVFSCVDIREHERIAGDNPCVSSGVPLSLGWGYYQHDSLGLDDYELNKGLARDKIEMMVPAGVRKQMLRDEFRVSITELNAAMREVNVTKRQRRHTVASEHLEVWAEIGQSAKRKFKRLINRTSTAKEEAEMWENAHRYAVNEYLKKHGEGSLGENVVGVGAGTKVVPEEDRNAPLLEIHFQKSDSEP